MRLSPNAEIHGNSMGCSQGGLALEKTDETGSGLESAPGRNSWRKWTHRWKALWLPLSVTLTPTAQAITPQEVEAFRAQLDSVETNGTNAWIRWSTCLEVQAALDSLGHDVSHYDVAFHPRAMTQWASGDTTDTYLTIQRYGVAATTHYLDGLLELTTVTGVEAAHPRVLFAPDAADSLRTLQSPGHLELVNLNAHFSANYADSLPLTYEEVIQRGHPEFPWRGEGNALLVLAFRAFRTQAPGDVQLARDWMFGLLDYPHWGSGDKIDRDLAADELLVATCFTYDRLFHLLSPEDRARARRQIANHAVLLHTYAASYSYYWWSDAWTQNHHAVNTAALAVAGYTLRHEIEEAEEWIATTRELLEGQLEIHRYEQDGAFHEGVCYWTFTLTYLLLQTEAILVNEGENLLAHHPWLKETLRYRLYTQHPADDGVVMYSDGGDWDWMGPTNVLRRLAREYRIPWAEHMAQSIIEIRGMDWVRASTGPYEYFFYDPSLIAADPQLPASELFPNLDLALLHSSWDADASIVSLKSGHPGGRAAYALYLDGDPKWQNLNAGHNHPNQNEITLYAHRNRLLWAPGTPRENNYTSHHNTAIIDGVGQVGEDHPTYPVGHIAEENSVGEVSAFFRSSHYDFVVGEAGESYPDSLGVQRFSRALLFIKPELLFLADLFQLDEAHEIHRHYHRYESPFEAEPERVVATLPQGPQLRIQVLAPDSVRIETGLAPPDSLQSRPDYFQARITPLPLAPEHVVVELMEMRAGAEVPAAEGKVHEIARDAVVVTAHEGEVFYHACLTFDAESPTAKARGLEGRAALVKHRKPGGLEGYFVAGATRLEVPQRALVLFEVMGDAPTPITLGVELDGSRVSIDCESPGEVRLYAPRAKKVTLNGVRVAFERDGGHILISLP